MSKVNQLVLCREDYKSTFEFEETLKNSIMLLLNAGYIMTVRYDEKGLGIIVIEYDYDDESFGGRYPRWLLPDELESVIWCENK